MNGNRIAISLMLMDLDTFENFMLTVALLGMVAPGAEFCGVIPFRSKNR